jgi:hypothetical protein
MAILNLDDEIREESHRKTPEIEKFGGLDFDNLIVVG